MKFEESYGRCQRTLEIADVTGIIDTIDRNFQKIARDNHLCWRMLVVAAVFRELLSIHDQYEKLVRPIYWGGLNLHGLKWPKLRQILAEKKLYT